MALRVRKDGRILCAAMHSKEEEDIYLDDRVHYWLSVEVKRIVTQVHEEHKNRGEWWWKDSTPEGITIDQFYLGENMNMEDLEEGDVVQLESGGPPMTVQTIHPGYTNISCVWVSYKGVPMAAMYKTNVLKLISKKSEAPTEAKF